jgi:hypothetical protein
LRIDGRKNTPNNKEISKTMRLVRIPVSEFASEVTGGSGFESFTGD